MKRRIPILLSSLIIAGYGSAPMAQIVGEYLEPTPEELDANFTAEAAARDAARWSNTILDHSTVDPLGQLVERADLILQGEVVSQSYTYDAGGVPYTHTTLAVSDVLRGEFAGDSYTIVQEGGPAKDDARRAMMVTSSRHFKVGEQELLFLQLPREGVNQASRPRISPLYTGPAKTLVQIRFRIFQGKVYDEDGHGVRVESLAGGAGHRLQRSDERSPDPRFREIHIGDHVLYKRFLDRQGDKREPAPGDARSTVSTRNTTPSPPLGADVAELRAAIVD